MNIYDESKDEILYNKALNVRFNSLNSIFLYYILKNGIYIIGIFALFIKIFRHAKIIFLHYLEALASNEEKSKSTHKKVAKKNE